MLFTLAFSLVACGVTPDPAVVDPNAKSEGTMTYAEYAAAEIDANVVIEGFVQGKQSWWNNKGTFYLQDGTGAYFVYELACTEEEYNRMTVGTKLKITGVKAEWAGEVEIIDATFEILENTWVAEATDLTSVIANEEELIKYQNMLAKFTDMTVKEISYKNGEPGDDIYVTLTKGGADYSFCVEVYLTGTSTDVYTTVGTLKKGDIVDVEGFLYWYNGMNPHITKITNLDKKAAGTMTYAEYAAAEIDANVVIEGFVQGKQSWWNNKGTFYLQDGTGAYFVYELACTEEEYNRMTVGTKLKITGVKAEWAGEVEIIDATFEILENTWVAEATDLTSVIANEEELIKYQNMLAKFTDMTVKEISYKNGEPGDDIYVTLTKGGADYSFCVEVYLTGTSTDVYTTVGTLATGDVVDVEGFLYWYNGMNPHITKITKK